MPELAHLHFKWRGKGWLRCPDARKLCVGCDLL